MKGRIKVNNVEEIENVACGSDERETTINFSYTDDKATIFTSDNTVITKVKKCIVKEPNQWECFEIGRNADDRVTGYLFKTNKSNVHLRSLSARETREYTEEERKALGERLRKNQKNS